MGKFELKKAVPSSPKRLAKTSPKKDTDVTVKVALIGLIGTILVAFFGFAGTVIPAFLNSPLGQRWWPPTPTLIATEIGQTVVLPTQPAETATASLEPSASFTPSEVPTLPTATAEAAIECDTITLAPEENAKIRRGQAFKIKFILLNSGETVWPENLELTLAANPDETLDPIPRPIKVPRVQPGDSITVGPFDAQAPNTVGRYVVTFKLGDGLCWPYVAFEVVK